MDQSIYKNEILIVEAKIHLVFVNEKGKPVRIPGLILEKFENYKSD